MKRLYTTVEYKRLIRIQQLRALKNARRHRGVEAIALPDSRLPFLRLTAPEHYSLIDNPEEAIGFLSRLHTDAKNVRLFVDLEKAKTITCDAVSVLAATIESDLCRPHVFGNWPEEEGPRQIVLDSGFHRRVRVHHSDPDLQLGAILRRDIYLDKDDTTVDTDIARQLVEFTRLKLGRPSGDKPSYGVLIDVMENTFAHASTVMTGQVSLGQVFTPEDERQSLVKYRELRRHLMQLVVEVNRT
jgi:hypothetical protein